jgi:WD40 repeat protein
MAADDGGLLHIFCAANVLDHKGEQQNENACGELYCWQAHHMGSIYALLYCEALGIVVSGGDHQICAWRFDEERVRTRQALECVWTFDVAKCTESRVAVECNSLAMSDAHRLLAACGDGCVHVLQLAAARGDGSPPQLIGSYGAHRNYVHCVVALGKSLAVSGSEDGAAHVFNVDTLQTLSVLDPVRLEAFQPERAGEWLASSSSSSSSSSSAVPARRHVCSAVTCVAVDDSGQWLALGSATGELSIWHVDSLSVVANVTLTAESSSASRACPVIITPQAVAFHRGTLCAVATDSCLRRYDYRLVETMRPNVLPASSMFAIAPICDNGEDDDDDSDGSPLIVAGSSNSFLLV